MAEFVYNNMKNSRTGHTLFELNCNYHPHALYKKDVDFYSHLNLADELANELRELITIYRKNLKYV